MGLTDFANCLFGRTNTILNFGKVVLPFLENGLLVDFPALNGGFGGADVLVGFGFLLTQVVEIGPPPVDRSGG